MQNVASIAISVASSMLDDVHREVAKNKQASKKIGLLYIIFPFAHYSSQKNVIAQNTTQIQNQRFSWKLCSFYLNLSKLFIVSFEFLMPFLKEWVSTFKSITFVACEDIEFLDQNLLAGSFKNALSLTQFVFLSALDF